MSRWGKPAAETLATNIAHRAGYKVTIKKIENYRVTHNGVKPVTPYKRG